MRYAIAIWVLTIVVLFIGFELHHAQHPSLPWVKRRRARRLRWQWARRPAGAAPSEPANPAAPSTARQQ